MAHWHLQHFTQQIIGEDALTYNNHNIVSIDITTNAVDPDSAHDVHACGCHDGLHGGLYELLVDGWHQVVDVLHWMGPQLGQHQGDGSEQLRQLPLIHSYGHNDNGLYVSQPGLLCMQSVELEL